MSWKICADRAPTKEENAHARKMDGRARREVREDVPLSKLGDPRGLVGSIGSREGDVSAVWPAQCATPGNVAVGRGWGVGRLRLSNAGPEAGKAACSQARLTNA